MKTRIKFILFSFSLFLIAVVARLFYWQIIRSTELTSFAKLQYNYGESILATRGSILSSDGSWLTSNVEGWLLYAEIEKLTLGAKDIANKLAPIFVEDINDKGSLLKETLRIEDLLSRRNAQWVPIKHRLGRFLKEKIEFLGIEGLGFESEELRIYPEGDLAAHTLGFVGKNDSGSDKGYFGLEGFWDLALQGKTGFIERELDALGVPIIHGNETEVSASSGVDLITHIDKGVQLIAQKKLAYAIEKYGANAGTIMIMDPYSGGILANVSYPFYEPQKYYDYGNEYFKDPSVSSTFEPGSIFKILIMASALDLGAVNPDTVCDMCDKAYKIDKYLIETWDRKYFPNSTMTEVIVHSDNVGMVFVAKKVGIDGLYGYLKKFGIGEKTGIDLQGEVSVPLRPKDKWSEIDLATASFGQGVAVTPIQMLAGVAVVANGGNLVRPQVVDKIVRKDWVEDVRPEIVRRVISESTARKIKNMMVEAVKKGEANWTNLKGFKVAGKTGTAQIPVSGHYDTEKTVASFVGFAPSDNPKFVMLITLKEPQSSQWASETAAPLWFDVAKDLFPYLGVQPEE
ncbi:hypothetical protein A2961_02785 [Candidatus Woesebacteria bacterium RIFCSPLOWO2_01_FULL_39_21]|uniref:Penicillin-binding protein transpeptidase domain-containing protein n=1 Tax=Candidatus Woesebacteria bacterium RIFCSPLOWO2_01_FULL_39_21 TaxID=1802519 RepID=A0A1F8BD39_9BACT|nr:MAG: hypothetical protein A2691_04620 [Candidatus Woesebacteria bacterium RIFCSPHIGHO2_01_FULL_39_23]OGM61966.1 MAG: hypothetical protein A2961_02785 [Candidatus Woesebacteria bacterium RIFCSPLOWO2_01_FULL_39_21]